MTARDDLAELRHFVAKLDAGEIMIRRDGRDVTRREADILRREIAHLETVLRRARDGNGEPS